MSATPRTDALETECAGWDKLRFVPGVVCRKSFKLSRELEGDLMRCADALRGMIGLVQLVQQRYPDFPVDNHRVIEAMSALNEFDRLHRYMGEPK